MIRLRLKKGYRLPVVGEPAPTVRDLETPECLLVHPARLPFVRPRLRVAEGQTVRLGSPLFEDRDHPAVRFLSPGGGRVERIVLGPRRIIQEVRIVLDAREEEESFPAYPEPDDLERLDRKELAALLLAGGLWPAFRAFPFRDMAPLDVPPPAIYLSLEAAEPFRPQPSVYLQGQETLFRYGLRVLEILSEGRLYLSAAPANRPLWEAFGDRITHSVSGPYPSDDPGVVLYLSRRSSDQNRSWFIDPQAVLAIASLLRFGRYPVEQVVTLGGPSVPTPIHLRTRRGVRLAFLARAAGAPLEGMRLIVGGVFRGIGVSAEDGLGFFDIALTLIPAGRSREFLALFKPGFRKATYSRAFASRLRSSPLPADCNCHGEPRACIACGHCEAVCPVDILPQLAYKALLAGETEEALRHGLLDCVECGLCAFVCPSKIELLAALQGAKADYRRELGGK